MEIGTQFQFWFENQFQKLNLTPVWSISALSWYWVFFNTFLPASPPILWQLWQIILIFENAETFQNLFFSKNFIFL
jgi:hypothetical protein